MNNPQYCRIFLGFVVNLGAGQFVMWLIVEKCMWPYVIKHNNAKHNKHALSWLVGLVERALYMTAFMVGAWQWAGAWLALKAVVRWRAVSDAHSEAGTGADNIWLIGSGLSLLIAFLGTWITLGYLPSFK
jgi:hypothetical protein